MARDSLTRLILSAAMVLGTAMTATAQTSPAQPSATQGADKPNLAAGECPPPAAQAEPATSNTATADGTAPANSGSTGWSGGTGGSHIGTNPQGATQHTKTWHAPTARGLDLTGRSEPAPVC